MKRLMRLTFKLAVVLVMAVLVFTLAIPLTDAKLASEPGPLDNAFERPLIPPDIEEEFDGEKKLNVSVRNTGNVDAYIRVAVVIQAKADDSSILAYNPIAGTDYSMTSLGSGWFKEGDFYYFRDPVQPGALTGILFPEIKALRNPIQVLDETPYFLNIEIAAQSIQALPARAVETCWPVTVGPGQALAPAAP